MSVFLLFLTSENNLGHLHWFKWQDLPPSFSFSSLIYRAAFFFSIWSRAAADSIVELIDCVESLYWQVRGSWAPRLHDRVKGQSDEEAVQGFPKVKPSQWSATDPTPPPPQLPFHPLTLPWSCSSPGVCWSPLPQPDHPFFFLAWGIFRITSHTWIIFPKVTAGLSPGQWLTQ